MSNYPSLCMVNSLLPRLLNTGKILGLRDDVLVYWITDRDSFILVTNKEIIF